MDTALPQKFLFILDSNLAKANCTGNRVCMSCDTVVIDALLKNRQFFHLFIHFIAEHHESLTKVKSSEKIQKVKRISKRKKVNVTSEPKMQVTKKITSP